MAKKSRRKNNKRKSRTRKKRGGWQRKDNIDSIGPFYNCRNKANKSKYREHQIITGNWDGIGIRPDDEWKIIRMEDSIYEYDPILQLVDMTLPEGQRGLRWFRQEAQQLCNRGYKPLKRNDAKTGAGRKQKGGERTPGNWIKYDEISPFDVCVFCEESLLNPTSPETTAYMLGCEHVGHTECIVDWCRSHADGRYDLVCPECDNEIWEDCTDTDEYLLLIEAERRGEELDDDAPQYDIFLNPNDYWRLPQLVVEPASIRVRPRRNRNVTSSVKPARSQGGRRKKKTRKKRGAVKFGKNKTTAEIVKEGRKILQTTPQKKRIKRREQQIKLTGEKEFALFKKQAMDRMKIAFIKSFNQPPSDKDGKMLSLVYKSLKQPLNKKENEIIQDYRAENNNNKRKLVWMNNSLRQLRGMSEKKKHQIYNTGDDPEVIKKYRSGKKQRKKGKATGLVINTYNMSPVKGPDTRYPKLTLDIGERSNKNLFKGGRKKKRRTRKKNRR